MTTHRTIDPFAYFENAAKIHKPKLAFTGENRRQFDAWKKKTLPQVLATLGRAPGNVDPNPELLVRWEQDGLIKERWVVDTQPGLSATVLIFRPANLGGAEKRPAILCCHGHGGWGKDAVMGNLPDKEADIAHDNYDYGRQMAKLGFVTYSLDWIGFGERNSKNKPHFHTDYEGRDACNVHYLCATMLGTSVMAMNLHDAKAVTDFVVSQPYVDSKNLGVMGLSLGGTLTTWVALYDPRFKAADIICYAGPFYDIAYRTHNVCGSQVTPGIYDLVDTFDIQGLIAPRPVLVELGIHDDCFHIDHTLTHYRKLESIFKAANADLELDLFPNVHSWGANKSEAFFRKHLSAQWTR